MLIKRRFLFGAGIASFRDKVRFRDKERFFRLAT